MALQQKLKDDLKSAMQAKNSLRLSVVRSLISECTNELLAKKRKPTDELADEEVVAVIKRAANQRKDSIEQFTKGGREELAEKEQQELEILQEYLPEELPREEIAKVVEAKKEALGITDKSGMGQLMGAVMQELKGQADGQTVKAIVEEALS